MLPKINSMSCIRESFKTFVYLRVVRQQYIKPLTSNSMKKLNLFFYIFIVILAMSSCNDTQSNTNRLTAIRKLKIESYLDSIQKMYPRYDSNSAIKDEMNAYLKKDFIQKFDNGLLNDLPFMLNRVEKCDKRYIINLEHSLTSKYYKTGLLNNLEIDLYCETDEQTAKGLTEKKFYLIDGKFKDYINFQNKEKYCAYVLMAPFLGFSKGIIDDEIQFGAIGIKLNSIKPFEKK